MAAQLEKQLKIALDEFLLQELAKIPGEMELSARQFFSRRFEHKMSRLLRHTPNEKPRIADGSRDEETVATVRFFTKGKKRLLIAAIILALLTSIMSISAAREAVISFFVHIYEEFSVIVFNETTGSEPYSTFSPSVEEAWHKLPTWTPPGYVQEGEISLSHSLISVTYKNDSNGVIIVDCFANSTLQIQINTEGVTTEEVYIGNNKGLYYSNKGYQTLIWKEHSNVYSIYGTINKTDLVNMAKSINR
jgi:hypothetical protein